MKQNAETKALVGLARRFAKATEDMLLAAGKTAPFTIGFHQLEQAEIDRFMELQTDQVFYESWRVSIALGGEEGVPAHITRRLNRLERSRNSRALEIGELFAKIVDNAEDAAGRKLIEVRGETAEAASEGFKRLGYPHLAKRYGR